MHSSPDSGFQVKDITFNSEAFNSLRGFKSTKMHYDGTSMIRLNGGKVCWTRNSALYPCRILSKELEPFYHVFFASLKSRKHNLMLLMFGQANDLFKHPLFLGRPSKIWIVETL